MNVRELIQVLAVLPQEAEVLQRGYEWGFQPVYGARVQMVRPYPDKESAWLGPWVRADEFDEGLPIEAVVLGEAQS